MRKIRIVLAVGAVAVAVMLASDPASGKPPQTSKGLTKAQGKAAPQGQAGLTKAGQGSANGGQGLDKAGSVVPPQGQAGLTKAKQGPANGQGLPNGGPKIAD